MKTYLFFVFLLFSLFYGCCPCKADIIDEASKDITSIPIYRINILQDNETKEKTIMMFGQISDPQLHSPELIETKTLPKILTRGNKEYSVISKKRTKIDYVTSNFSLQINLHETKTEKVFIITGKDVLVFTNSFFIKETKE